MTPSVRIAIIGDYNPDSRSHAATNESLSHTAGFLSVPLEYQWVSTQRLSAEGTEGMLKAYHGVWAAPGSPYASTAGALGAIRFAREKGWPFIGT